MKLLFSGLTWPFSCFSCRRQFNLWPMLFTLSESGHHSFCRAEHSPAVFVSDWDGRCTREINLCHALHKVGSFGRVCISLGSCWQKEGFSISQPCHVETRARQRRFPQHTTQPSVRSSNDKTQCFNRRLSRFLISEYSWRWRMHENCVYIEKLANNQTASMMKITSWDETHGTRSWCDLFCRPSPLIQLALV